MSAPARLGLFAGLLAAVFALAALAGGAVDPGGAEADRRAEHPSGAHTAPGHDEEDRVLPGLAVAQGDTRLVLDADRLARSSAAPIRFRIVDPHGAPVRDFDVAHDRRMHLVVVRRDLGTFEHLHPRMRSDGTWQAAADLSAAGTYRVFADFTRGGEQRTLGADLHVPGAFASATLPAPASTATATGEPGLTVRRSTEPGGRVAFRVLRDGRDVMGELEPYLGARGHLVTLRAADLAYLHTHPAGDRLAFAVDHPTPGTYRSWVQFQLDGVVRTAAFTEELAP